MQSFVTQRHIVGLGTRQTSDWSLKRRFTNLDAHVRFCCPLLLTADTMHDAFVGGSRCNVYLLRVEDQ